MANMQHSCEEAFVLVVSHPHVLRKLINFVWYQSCFWRLFHHFDQQKITILIRRSLSWQQYRRDVRERVGWPDVPALPSRRVVLRQRRLSRLPRRGPTLRVRPRRRARRVRGPRGALSHLADPA